MPKQRTILLVSQSPEVRDAVTHAIGNNSNGFAIGPVCQDLDKLAALMEQAPKEAVLVDIDPNPQRTLTNLERLSRQFTQTSFIVLADEFQNELLLDAMHAGVRHCMMKSRIASELKDSLKRLVPDEHMHSPHQGRAITMLSGGGGSGATTLAINLANELTLLTEEPTLLIDLDANYGSIATNLGLHGRFGIADILTRTGEIDAQLVRTTCQAYSERLFALVNPAAVDISRGPQMRYDRLTETIVASKYAYRCVVIDAPRLPIDAVARLVGLSDMTFMVFQLTVKDVSVVRRSLHALRDKGVSIDNITLLANRYRRRHSMISPAETSESLDGKTILCLSNDYRNTVGCANFGRVLSEYAPRSILRQELKGLAENVFTTYLSPTRVKLLTGQQQ